MLDGLLAKVRLIHESLGGDRGEAMQSAAAKGDKFAELRIQTEVKLHEVTQVQDERDKLRDVRGAGCIGELHSLLEELSSVLEQQRKKPDVSDMQKYNELDLDAKANKVELLRRQVVDAEAREGSGSDAIDREHLGGDGNELGRKEDPSDAELVAQKRWVEDMKYQDEVAERIGENAVILKQHAQVIGDALDSHMNKLDAVDQIVDKAGKELETSTKRVKRILQKVREGDKFCVTLVLLLILIGLATVAVNMFTG